MDERKRNITRKDCILLDTEICTQMGSDCDVCGVKSMGPEEQGKLLKALYVKQTTAEPQQPAAPQPKKEKFIDLSLPSFKKGDCLLQNTEICRLMAKECEHCDVRRMKQPDQEKLISTYETILRLLPEGALAELQNSPTCLFCKDGIQRPRSCYATFEMGHEEPKGMKRILIGIRVKQRIGSMVTLSAACCTRCRVLFLLRDWISVFSTAVLVMLGVLGLTLPGLRAPLESAFTGLPYIWLAGCILLCIPFWYLFRRLYTRSVSNKVKLDLNELVQVQRMRDNGWFMLSEMDSKGKQSVLFSKKPNRGLLPIGDTLKGIPEDKNPANN